MLHRGGCGEGLRGLRHCGAASVAGTHHLVLKDVKLVLVEGIATESSELEKGDRCNAVVGYPDVALPKDISCTAGGSLDRTTERSPELRNQGPNSWQNTCPFN